MDTVGKRNLIHQWTYGFDVDTHPAGYQGRIMHSSRIINTRYTRVYKTPMQAIDVSFGVVRDYVYRMVCDLENNK